MGKYIINIRETTDRIICVGVKDGETYASGVSVSCLMPYTEPDLERVRLEAEQLGMVLAWDAAKKIENLCEAEKFEIFGEYDMFHIMRRYTASEVIEKIRQYEQAQKELEQEKEEQIHVGDEVATDAGNRASVLYENPDGTQAFVFKSDGTAAWWTKSALHRTGRNFPEIATVLEKMRGEQDGKRREE